MQLETVRSFSEYTAFISELTVDIVPLHGLRFGLWCLQRFKAQYPGIIWDGLNASEQRQLEAIIAELEHCAVAGELPSPERAAQLERTVNDFGPHDQTEAIDVDPLATDFLCMVSFTLEWCYAQTPSSLCAISEQYINALDYDQEDTGYSLETMFCAPDLRHELELQVAFLLQGQ